MEDGEKNQYESVNWCIDKRIVVYTQPKTWKETFIYLVMNLKTLG